MQTKTTDLILTLPIISPFSFFPRVLFLRPLGGGVEGQSHFTGKKSGIWCAVNFKVYFVMKSHKTVTQKTILTSFLGFSVAFLPKIFSPKWGKLQPFSVKAEFSRHWFPPISPSNNKSHHFFPEVFISHHFLSRPVAIKNISPRSTPPPNKTPPDVHLVHITKNYFLYHLCHLQKFCVSYVYPPIFYDQKFTQNWKKVYSVHRKNSLHC